jgi:biopolymer transport protein ExbD
LETVEKENMQREIFNRVFANRKRHFTLRMVPMIDMIFLLLIFFFVAAKYRPEENFLPLQLPAAQAQEYRLGKPEPLIINISAIDTGCQVQIGQFRTVQIENEKMEANLVALMEEIRNCLRQQKRVASDPIEIVCSPEVKWEHVAKIYNMFFGAGLTDITFRMTQ